jgi:stage II sporulation protein D
MPTSNKIALSLALVVAFVLVPGTGARAGGDFDFYGSGYGHGLGLSQYGALGLARGGWGAERIVEHYFKHTNVNQRTPPDPTIKVGLLQNRHITKLTAAVGSFDLELQNGTSVDTVHHNQSRKIIIVDGQYRVKKANGDVVGGLWGGPGNDLLAKRNGGGRISVPAWGHQVGRGKVRFNIIDDNDAHVLAVVKVEQYVFGISEVPNSWPKRALRAQAIMARTYGYWRLAGALRSGCGCDVYTSTVDQVYTGWTKESSPGGNRWVSAVRQTRKKVLTHNGNYVYTPYSSSSGGHTENIENVWVGASPAAWLKGVCDPRDDVDENPNTTWVESFSPATVTNSLQPYTGNIGTVQNFTAYDFGVSGRVTKVKVVGGQGSKVVEGWDIRQALGLPDTRFFVEENHNITGQIRQKYDSLGCRPGRAKGPKRDIDGGAYQRFKRGRIYRNAPEDKQVWVRGPVLQKYLDEGGHQGPLGLPVKFVRLNNGAKGVFDGGIIVCTGGCTVTYD